jgi:hypothetical protein
MIFYMILMSDVQNDSEIGPLLHAVCEVAGRGCGCSRPSREVSLKSRPDAEIAKKKRVFFVQKWVVLWGNKILMGY